MDCPDPELHGSMSGSNLTALGKKINQPKKNLKLLLLFTVLSLLSIWNRDNGTANTDQEYKKTNTTSLKKNFNSEYDPLMPTEDDVTETSDAEAMRILEEEDDADPAANASATAAASDAVSDPAAAQTCAVPARAGIGTANQTESSDTMDTTDPSKARMDPAPGSAIFKTPEAPPAKAPGKSGHSGSVPPPDQSPPRHGSSSGSGPGSGSGSSSRSSSSSDSEYSSAFSSCERNELPPLYYTVKKARASSLAPRVLGQGPDNNFFDKFGDFASDPRHVYASHRHSFDKKTNISTSFSPTDMLCNTCENKHPVLERGGGAGLTGLTPKCFYLSDQCFPPVLPSSGGGASASPLSGWSAGPWRS